MRLPDPSSLDNMNNINLEASISDELNHYIHHYFGHSLDAILAPVGEQAVGESVRHNGVYFKIKEARRNDNPSLPQGVWTHELKTADWELVEKTAVEALCTKSKDLQLGVWLMESSIHRHGFAGIAPAALVIRCLCQQYWEVMYPEMIDGDIEYRTNPINWINEKLSICLKLIPITHGPLDGREYTLSDWENAQRYEKMRLQQQGNLDWQGVDSDTFKQRLAASDTDFLQQLCAQLDDALCAIASLTDWLDSRCGDQAPSLHELTSLLTLVVDIAGDELSRRGLAVLSPPSPNQPPANRDLSLSPQGGEEDGQGGGGGSEGGGGDGGDDSGGNSDDKASTGAICHRHGAFLRLREAAEFLMQDDPHSPVPYMVYTACQWGEKSAPDLYQELFLEKGGQLNIFEMMGLALEKKER